MEQTTIDGNVYSIGKLDARTQFHIARRLAPIVASLTKTAIDHHDFIHTIEKSQEESNEESESFMSVAAGPLAEALSKMSDEDVDYIINKCLAVCKRQQANGGWAAVKSGNGNSLMFDDIEMSGMMNLTMQVVQSNLASFFPTGARTSTEKVQ